MHRGLDQADVRAAIETAAFETIRIDGFLLEQPGNRIGQLDFAACAGAGFFEQFEDLRAGA